MNNSLTLYWYSATCRLSGHASLPLISYIKVIYKYLKVVLCAGSLILAGMDIFVIASHLIVALTRSKHLFSSQHWFILWESHLNFGSNGNLLKHNVTIMRWRNKVHKCYIIRQNVHETCIFCLYLTDHRGEFKLCIKSFNPHVTVIQSLRMHLSQILAAVSKPIN